MTLLIQVHSENDSRMYFLIELITDYCWRPTNLVLIDWLTSVMKMHLLYHSHGNLSPWTTTKLLT